MVDDCLGNFFFVYNALVLLDGDKITSNDR
jgi:hypothetical protein